ncbi:MAG TPA: endolytic transglycosylase MltG, partial [Candidatus Kapabacteria bacterium]|nr:endolytic transglycosylase MltG [Candidatus Kapabacteria bacterium]
LMATFPEGITALRASRIAANKLKLDSNLFRKLIRDTAFLREQGLPKEAKTAEGYLFPDTYQFFISADPKSLITLMLGRWNDIVTDSLKQEINKRGMTVHEFMTLASIVEAEAQVPSERDTIAGVYHNRLRIGMKLDADPTVQYGHGLERPITGTDVRRDNPYNTYMRRGLPPGPINNPGKAAILATLNPAKHDYLYFVARRDGTGGHYFSKNIGDQTRMIGVARKNAAARDTNK